MNAHRHMSPTDEAQAHALVLHILAQGHLISVNDDMDGGGEWVIKQSGDAAAIIEAMASTDGDRLKVRTADGVAVASLVLIYGNGPGELVADYGFKQSPEGQALADWIDAQM